MVLTALLEIIPLHAADFEVSKAISSSARYQIPRSEIFSYDTSMGAAPGYLHADIKRGNWTANDITAEDISFTQALFANDRVMSGFADGQVRETDATVKRVMESWIPRFAKGQPHGGLTVRVDGKEAASAVAGLGDRVGTSEIALAISPDYQDGKLAMGLCETLVKLWAPDVRRIGLGVGLTERDMPIVNAFRCFGGDSDAPKTKVLRQLDATASPSNVGSWLVLTRNGFTPARCGLVADYDIIDLTTGGFEFSGGQDKFKENYKGLEAYVLATYFDTSKATNPIAAGQRCILISPDGTEFTLSKHIKWDRLKFHWELQVITHH